MNWRRRPTLAQAFVAIFVAFAGLACGLLSLFYLASRHTLLAAADQLSAETSVRVSAAIDGHLAAAERVLGAFEAKVDQGLYDLDAPAAALGALRAELAGHPQVSALSLTRAEADGFFATDGEDHEAGDARLRPQGRWQVAVARHGCSVTTTDAGRWYARTGCTELATAELVEDPTAHPTFVTPARDEQRGRTLWSDLYLASRSDRQRVVTVQKALWSRARLAVLRVTLPSERIDQLVALPLATRAGVRPLVFISDAHGHLVARLAPEDQLLEMDDDEVRVIPAHTPPALAAALALPALGQLAPGASTRARLRVPGGAHRLDLVALPAGRTQGWVVGTLVPEAYHLAGLEASLRRVLVLAVLLVVLGLGAGALVLRATRRDLTGLLRQIGDLRRFDFAPVALLPVFADVGLAADGLEQAKTALRALGKYAPLDLVRQLYDSRREPRLGGRAQEVSLVFSDIEGFTTFSETLPLDLLATALGRYLEAVTEAIHAARGIIDKYTGDGVMALWNAPTPCPDHARWACAAVLAARAAADRLFASAAWAGLTPWRTRFGVHTATVNVGHFGAPTRMSYTAMGDGVNLAARLEGLNKLYGTQILVSDEVAQAAAADFWFRRVDRVAVKGKRAGTDVCELLAPRQSPRPPVIVPYERALDAYLARRFDDALAHLAPLTADGPTAILAERCRRLIATPPPADWSGVYVAQAK